MSSEHKPHSELVALVQRVVTSFDTDSDGHRIHEASAEDALAALDILMWRLERLEPTGDLKSNMARNALNPASMDTDGAPLAKLSASTNPYPASPAIDPNIEPGCCGLRGPKGCGDIEPFDQSESAATKAQEDTSGCVCDPAKKSTDA